MAGTDLSKLAAQDKLRILVCRRCATVNELPFREHNPNEPDPFIMAVLQSHQACGQERGVGGHTPDEASKGDRFVAVLEKKHWNNTTTRQEILEQIRGGNTGFAEKVYAVRNTFQEDAMKCFAKHGRPKDGCIDYKDKSKAVGNQLLDDDEKLAQRKSGLLTMMKSQTPKTVYVCDWCPVKSKVQEKVFTKKGLYK